MLNPKSMSLTHVHRVQSVLYYAQIDIINTTLISPNQPTPIIHNRSNRIPPNQKQPPKATDPRRTKKKQNQHLKGAINTRNLLIFHRARAGKIHVHTQTSAHRRHLLRDVRARQSHPARAVLAPPPAPWPPPARPSAWPPCAPRKIVEGPPARLDKQGRRQMKVQIIRALERVRGVAEPPRAGSTILLGPARDPLVVLRRAGTFFFAEDFSLIADCQDLYR